MSNTRNPYNLLFSPSTDALRRLLPDATVSTDTPCIAEEPNAAIIRRVPKEVAPNIPLYLPNETHENIPHTEKENPSKTKYMETLMFYLTDSVVPEKYLSLIQPVEIKENRKKTKATIKEGILILDGKQYTIVSRIHKQQLRRNNQYPSTFDRSIYKGVEPATVLDIQRLMANTLYSIPPLVKPEVLEPVRVKAKKVETLPPSPQTLPPLDMTFHFSPHQVRLAQINLAGEKKAPSCEFSDFEEAFPKNYFDPKVQPAKKIKATEPPLEPLSDLTLTEEDLSYFNKQ